MRPLITLTTDYGLSDAYVAEMKAAVFAHCPDATIVDVTHLIPPQDVLSGAIALERAIRAFPAGTVHVAVIDPGVGTARKILAAHVRGQTVLVPDNGLITWAYRRFGNDAATIEELIWRPEAPFSTTFHGRDIFAPAAGMIASQTMPAGGFAAIEKFVLLDAAPATSLSDARILSIDHFGNAVTNLPAALVTVGMRVNDMIPVHRTYDDVARGSAVALVGSSGLLEIAVNCGHAARQCALNVGDPIHIR